MKWKKRDFVDDAPMGPKEFRSTVLTPEEEVIIVAFRRYTLLPLDDCLNALQVMIPHLTRSSLHRCLQRHGISRLPDMKGDQPRKKFRKYPIGYFHIDIAEVRTEEGKLYLFVAIDRTSKLAYVELHERQTKAIAADFLRNLIENIPYWIHTVLTDNGIQFTNQVRQKYAFRHIFARIPQMDCQFDDLLGRFCYKNQCNTIIATGQTRLTLRVTQESSLCGSISTAA